MIVPEHTNKQDLTFQNHPEIIPDDSVVNNVAYNTIKLQIRKW